MEAARMLAFTEEGFLLVSPQHLPISPLPSILRKNKLVH
jgi:hypothetical protein